MSISMGCGESLKLALVQYPRVPLANAVISLFVS